MVVAGVVVVGDGGTGAAADGINPHFSAVSDVSSIDMSPKAPFPFTPTNKICQIIT